MPSLFILMCTALSMNAVAAKKINLADVQVSASAAAVMNQKSLLSVGNEGGHGGDSYAVEFVSLGKEIVANLAKVENRQLLESTGVDIQKIQKALDTVKVYSRDPSGMILNGEELDAINFPAVNEIAVNRTRWESASLNQKLNIVLHEYFGIANVERDTYEVSTAYATDLRKLSAEILSRGQNPQSYSGVCEEGAALGANVTCSENDPDLKPLMKCARDKAIASCQRSSGGLCQIIGQRFESFASSVALGYRGCKASAIAH